MPVRSAPPTPCKRSCGNAQPSGSISSPAESPRSLARIARIRYDARLMLLRVGQSPSALAIARYGKHLDLLEVRLDNGVPRRRTLEAMKSESPADLVFAVLAPKRLTSL